MIRKFGPKNSTHPSIGEVCKACGNAFVEGDYTTLIALGPGDDEEQQHKAKGGKPYTAVAVEIHYACAGGR